MPNDLNAKQAAVPQRRIVLAAQIRFRLMIRLLHSVIITGHTLDALVLINES